MKNIIRIAALVSLAFMASVAGAGAQEWEFRVTPYAWMSGLSGEVGTIPGLPAGSIDLSFGDILEELEFAGMLMVSARNGPWVIYLDTTYVRTSLDGTARRRCLRPGAGR